MPSDRKLTYGRQSKALEPNPEREVPVERLPKAPVVKIGFAPSLSGYSKTDGVFSYNIVCVISGGEKRESNFLDELISKEKLRSLRVAFLSKEGQGLQPYQMQVRWSEIQKTGKIDIDGLTYILDEVDKVFLLSDVDEFYNQLVKIFAERSENDSGQWIISNPCFEMWLYYCFKNSPLTDLASIEPLSVDKRSQELKRLGDIVVNGGLNPFRAFEKMSEGIKHSLEHYAEDEIAIPILFATQMHQMAQYLIDTMNRNANEYDEFVRQKREWREKMRKDV